jgi:predicted XRE-type DNA-binding protein
MSHSELTRLEILQRIEDRRLSQAQAATMLGLTDRQMRRLVHRYRAHGPEGLVSKKRGMRGNHRRPQAFRDHILAIVRERYPDFGPTLAREKLLERHGLVVPCETLRGWMKQAGIWLPRAARKFPVQQPQSQTTVFWRADPDRWLRTSLV